MLTEHACLARDQFTARGEQEQIGDAGVQSVGFGPATLEIDENRKVGRQPFCQLARNLLVSGRRP